MDYFNAIIM